MTALTGAPQMELWGGAECTVNRLGDGYRDQTRLSGHQDRPEDLDLFASLGIRKLRYPVLWERVAPDSPGKCDWRWSDDRLARIRELGITPIVGLLHHGSGPRYTSLVDDGFASLFSRYAGAVAARYSDIVDWTPVNEPLTTARFSALYGHWYPHARDERLFWAALLNQIDGTRAAMRAIRAVNPAAQLIQTEDLGHCYATTALASVAHHYNHRRWMTWDLLAGQVDRAHPLWEHLDRFGFGDRLRVIADDPCPADVIGVNHYITSDRFLDDRRDAHDQPPPAEGYHDISAIRTLEPAPPGLSAAVREAWNRYAAPVVVTECHLTCTREEQLRWLNQAWRECLALRRDGVDVRALTAWALLGSTDWNSLLTRSDDHYESGAFEVRSGTPRPTAIAALLTTLGRGAKNSTGVAALLQDRGWWQRDVRLEHPAFAWTGESANVPASGSAAPLMITDAAGVLGQALAQACRMRGITYVLYNRAECPLNHADEIAAALDRHQPWAVMKATGWALVDELDVECVPSQLADAMGAAELSRACALRGIHCTMFSSDFVVDETLAPFDETGAPFPLGVYQLSKVEAERQVIAAGEGTLIVCAAAPFSPIDPHNLAPVLEGQGGDGASFVVSTHDVESPTYVPALVQACLDLVIDGATGIWHLTNGEAVSCGRNEAQPLAAVAPWHC